MNLVIREVCPSCVVCRSEHVRWLEALSLGAWVNYYRCNACGHVANVPKPGMPGDLTHVTTGAK